MRWWEREVREVRGVRSGWGVARDVLSVAGMHFVAPQMASHTDHDCALRSAGQLNPAAAPRRGADSSAALHDAKSSDGLYQVGTLRIARPGTDPNTSVGTSGHQSNNVKCVTLLYGNLLSGSIRILELGEGHRSARGAPEKDTLNTLNGLHTSLLIIQSECLNWSHNGTAQLQGLHRSAGDFSSRGRVWARGPVLFSGLRCRHWEEGDQPVGLSSPVPTDAGEVNRPLLDPKPLWHRGAGVRDGQSNRGRVGEAGRELDPILKRSFNPVKCERDFGWNQVKHRVLGRTQCVLKLWSLLGSRKPLIWAPALMCALHGVKGDLN